MLFVLFVGVVDFNNGTDYHYQDCYSKGHFSPLGFCVFVCG